MNFYTFALKFAAENPFMSLCIIILIPSLTYYTLKLILYYIPNRWIRHLNIKKHGWPPEHLDADGDTHHKEVEETLAEKSREPYLHT